jgi:hypothetical protein
MMRFDAFIAAVLVAPVLAQFPSCGPVGSNCDPSTFTDSCCIEIGNTEIGAQWCNRTDNPQGGTLSIMGCWGGCFPADGVDESVCCNDTAVTGFYTCF